MNGPFMQGFPYPDSKVRAFLASQEYFIAGELRRVILKNRELFIPQIVPLAENQVGFCVQSGSDFS